MLIVSINESAMIMVDPLVHLSVIEVLLLKEITRSEFPTEELLLAWKFLLEDVMWRCFDREIMSLELLSGYNWIFEKVAIWSDIENEL